MKRASLNNLQQASQDTEQAEGKKPEPIGLPLQIPVEGFKRSEQSDNNTGVDET